MGIDCTPPVRVLYNLVGLARGSRAVGLTSGLAEGDGCKCAGTLFFLVAAYSQSATETIDLLLYTSSYTHFMNGGVFIGKP